MNEVEATRIAEQARRANLPGLTIERVTFNGMVSRYDIKCSYDGPDKELGNDFIIHGIAFWIKSPADYVRLARLLTEGVEVKRCVYQCHQRSAGQCRRCGKNVCPDHSRLVLEDETYRVCFVCDKKEQSRG